MVLGKIKKNAQLKIKLRIKPIPMSIPTRGI
jgi:hypothetical protein